MYDYNFGQNWAVKSHSFRKQLVWVGFLYAEVCMVWSELGEHLVSQELDAVIIARSSHCEFDVRIYRILHGSREYLLALNNYADTVIQISFPARSRYRALRA